MQRALRDDFARKLVEPVETVCLDSPQNSIEYEFIVDEYQGNAAEELGVDPRDKEILPESESRAETTREQTVIGEAQKNIQGPNRKRKARITQRNIKKSTMEYLEEKNSSKTTLKEKELEVEEKRLQLEREKLEFEKEKFEMEKQERKALMQLLEKQQLFLTGLMETVIAKNITFT
ncbi:unnamed protein product [Ceutorhynchus assimilis]|uniref:Uncharacterized protein n=1 Tax=Ceutorhynchus assimilis TaxID=467358 RepID=A0A9N9MH48_9CUCU|nr:unnamed protein product [Ceutorhynchus assimilis]